MGDSQAKELSCQIRCYVTLLNEFLVERDQHKIKTTLFFLFMGFAHLWKTAYLTLYFLKQLLTVLRTI